MPKQVFGSSDVPLSPAVRAGDLIFVSGQVPVVDGQIVEGGIDMQTRAVLENIRTCLELAGCSLQDVVKTTVWLRDRDDFAAFNDVYAEYFPIDPPARSIVEAGLMIDIRVGIEAFAYKPL